MVFGNANDNITIGDDTELKPVETQAESADTEEPDGGYYITFKKPFVWEDETYTGVDLSGLEDLSARDMISTQRMMERSGSINVLPEMSLEYACIFASKASGLPQEFFQSLPPREAIKIKNRVTSFFYGEE
jgi:hypothetical protein